MLRPHNDDSIIPGQLLLALLFLDYADPAMLFTVGAPYMAFLQWHWRTIYAWLAHALCQIAN